MRGVRAREARWGGGRGGVAAERPVDAAARPTNSGEVFRSLRSSNSTTCDAGVLLTSRRSSRTASRRRSGSGGGEPKAAMLGFRWRRKAAARARVGGSRGGGRLIRDWGGPLACAPRTGRRARVGLAAAAQPRPSPGRGRRGGRDDMRAPPVSGSGCGSAGRRR
jgi:hypothetical protein